jgi:hypothetical protein
MGSLLILVVLAAALWFFHSGLELIERARAAGEYVRSWSSAIVGGGIALFVITDVMPHVHAWSGHR